MMMMMMMLINEHMRKNVSGSFFLNTVYIRRATVKKINTQSPNTILCSEF